MKIFQSSFTGTSSVYFSFYSYNIQQCSISRIATCTEGRFHWYWQNQYVLLNTQIQMYVLLSLTNHQWEHRWCDDMIWYGVEDVSIYQASDRSQSWACVTWQAGPGWPLAIPWDNAAAEPCPLSGDNWWVLPCHLGQETLHTGTSPWPPSTSHLNWDRNCVPIILQGSWSWGFYAFFLLFIICFGKIFLIFHEKHHCVLPCQLVHVTSRLTLTHPIQAFSSQTMFQLFILLAHNTFKHYLFGFHI